MNEIKLFMIYNAKIGAQKPVIKNIFSFCILKTVNHLLIAMLYNLSNASQWITFVFLESNF